MTNTNKGSNTIQTIHNIFASSFLKLMIVYCVAVQLNWRFCKHIHLSSVFGSIWSWSAVSHIHKSKQQLSISDASHDETGGVGGGCSTISATPEQLHRHTLYEIYSPRSISEVNVVSKPQGCCTIATTSLWNWWRSPLLSWAATSPHKTMQRIIIFKVFHYGWLTLANSDLTL